MRNLEKAYIVFTDRQGKEALSLCLDVGSEEFSDLMREAYPISRLASEAALGVEVASEIDRP